MESLKLENQRSLEGENDQTTQDLQSLLKFDSVAQIKGRSSSAYQDDFEEDKYEETDKFTAPL